MTQEQINSLVYFWREKGDLDRCTEFESLKPELWKDHPEILMAWYDYKRSLDRMNNAINELAQCNNSEQL